jgi:hypothetical protein
MEFKPAHALLIIAAVVFGSYGLEMIGANWNQITAAIIGIVIVAAFGPRILGRLSTNSLSPEQLDTARFLLGMPSEEENLVDGSLLEEEREHPEEEEGEPEPEPQDGSRIFTLPVVLPEQRAGLHFGLDQRPPLDLSQTELDLAPNLRVHPDTLFSGRVLVAGMPGSGKTNTMRLLIEKTGRPGIGLPFLLIDTDGEYASLVPHLAHPYLVGEHNREHLPNFVAIHDYDAQEFGREILSERRQVIFDVRSYQDQDGEVDENAAAQVFLSLLRGMRQWQESTPQHERIPSMVFLEEAQVWLPQQASGSTLSPSVRHSLLSLVNRSARDGRRRGIGLVVIAHRIAGIQKEVLQCDWMILHRPQNTDIRRYRELAPHVHAERFLHLPTGRAVVISPAGTSLVTFHKASSQDGGETPGLARLYQEPAEPRTYHTPASEELKKAQALWNNGNGSVRKLADAMHIEYEDARVLRLQMIKRGMIHVGDYSR